MALIKYLLEKLFGCRHRFLATEVTDLNCEPKCVKCGKYFTAIADGQFHRFVDAKDDKHYKIKRIR